MLFERYAAQDVHFMKIDCDGTEKQVLKSIDLRKYRPRIIVVEATDPMGQNANLQ
jgi:hypothetical protein